MVANANLLIVGASVRAAAFSALRAGLQPLCADQFADADLCARCPAVKLAGKYPDGFRDFLIADHPGPWMYTGGLENHADFVESIARGRRLWGNQGTTLKLVRNPFAVAEVLRKATLPVPEICRGAAASADKRWLVKPVAGSGGNGVRFWHGEKTKKGVVSPHCYLQEFIEGLSASALFVGDGKIATLLGATRQIVGASWLHAAPFQYCGSIGPELCETALVEQLKILGTILTAETGLQGLFGIDGILKDGNFWPVEINPRYTASAEVLEYSTGLKAMAWHRRIFDSGAPKPANFRADSTVVGKAIFYAKGSFAFPANGPWSKVLREPPRIDEMPDYADIPRPGERIEAGQPVLSFFARAGSISACEDELRRIAAHLDRWLIGNKLV